MEHALIWLGIYLKLRNVFKFIKLFEENSDPEALLNVLEFKKEEVLTLAKRELERAEKLGITLLFRENFKDHSLGKINLAPVFLYVKGVLNLEVPLIAIIGSRKPSSYGKEVTKSFSKGFAELEIGVVSGLARGIDSIAHKTVVEAGGYTIAVLGSGLDVIYPSENKGLFERILQTGGAVVTEFPLGTKPRKENFPMRNRIISGLSQGIVVVEAAQKSGTLITAKWALEQGKEVFAVPGSIYSPQSQGTHYLIKQGAIPVSSAEEVCEFLELSDKKSRDSQKNKIEEVPLSEEEKEVISLLSPYPQHIEEVIEKTEIPAFELLAIITELELKGIVETLPGKYIKLKKFFIKTIEKSFKSI